MDGQSFSFMWFPRVHRKKMMEESTKINVGCKMDLSIACVGKVQSSEAETNKAHIILSSIYTVKKVFLFCVIKSLLLSNLTCHCTRRQGGNYRGLRPGTDLS